MTTGRHDRMWLIRDIMSHVKPQDLTDAELAAAIAIFGLADAGYEPGDLAVSHT